MELPIPVCLSGAWPSNLESARDKFAVYDQKKRILFAARDRKAELPKIAIWSMGSGDTIYSSTCLLWDVLHVYHHMGVLYWNEGVRQMADHQAAKKSFLEAYKMFRAISEKILPAWLPACRLVQRHEKDTSLTLMFPPFLVTDYWKHWSNLSLAMVHRVMIDKAVTEKMGDGLISRIAMGGYNLLKDLPRTESVQLKKIVEEHKNVLKTYALVYWTRNTKSSTEPNIHGRQVKILQDLAKTPIILPGIEDLKNEAATCEQTNNSMFFELVPQENIENDVLSLLPTTNVTEKDIQGPVACCVE
jgi:hypothetical protein